MLRKLQLSLAPHLFILCNFLKTILVIWFHQDTRLNMKHSLLEAKVPALLLLDASLLLKNDKVGKSGNAPTKTTVAKWGECAPL